MRPWSISTTVRNPNRIKEFLSVLAKIEGEPWNEATQVHYQVLLIKERLYGYGQPQFYRDLSRNQRDIIDDRSQEIPLQVATQVFQWKNYEDPAMRGRQSINPLKKFGLAAVDSGKVEITPLGHQLLRPDGDIGEVLLRCFLKWQFPNPDALGYDAESGWNLKPFVGTLHLLAAVNRKEAARGRKAKGLSRAEFNLFVPTLFSHEQIDDYADRVLALRDEQEGQPLAQQSQTFERHQRRQVAPFVTGKTTAEKVVKNLRDYGDNTLRYFRLTRYIAFRGWGRYVDLEPRRDVEISALLAADDGRSRAFESAGEHRAYIASDTEPSLPWETREKLTEIIVSLCTDVERLETRLDESPTVVKDYKAMDEDRLQAHIDELRVYRQALHQKVQQLESQEVASINGYMEMLGDIYEYDERPTLLEKLATQSLLAMNDALAILPNYPVGDDDEPTYTAPANVPDIECFYSTFNAICEVTMLTRREQWYYEGQPVMRHLRDFEDEHSEKPAYCLFVAPSLHRDTVNTFWLSVKHGYEGSHQRIVPLTIEQLSSVLGTLTQLKAESKALRYVDILHLYNAVVAAAQPLESSLQWLEAIPQVIAGWQSDLLRQA